MITQATERAVTQAATPKPATERNNKPPEKSFAELLGSRAGKTREPAARTTESPGENGKPPDETAAEDVQAAARLIPIIVLPPVSLQGEGPEQALALPAAGAAVAPLPADPAAAAPAAVAPLPALTP
ncbi:MAG: hypothetical protein LBH21_05470, partial [Gracilibacteraceae bacterium]|nr:hypothetical protein [Gracilibacteraceae bacterium]